MFTFKADSSTGVLSPVGNPATVSANNDSDIRLMKTLGGTAHTGLPGNTVCGEFSGAQ